MERSRYKMAPAYFYTWEGTRVRGLLWGGPSPRCVGIMEIHQIFRHIHGLSIKLVPRAGVMQVPCGCGRGMTCQGGLALVPSDPSGSGDEVHGMTSEKHGTSSQCAAGGRARKSPNGKHNSYRILQANINMAADRSM